MAAKTSPVTTRKGRVAAGDVLPDETLADEANHYSWLKRMSEDPQLWIALSFVIIMLLACFVWPLVYPVPKPILGASVPFLPPFSPHHLFGTDELGNDVFSRILYGGRVSLEVGFGSVLIGGVIGGTIGAVAAFKGGLGEVIVMRLLEVLLAFPSLVLAIVIATYLGPSEIHVIWAISFFSIPAFARLARANTLRLRQLDFILAARLCGTGDRRIVLRHLVPNIRSQLITFGLLGVGISIVVEAALSFLGLGVPPPGPSWGNMIAVGEQNLTSYPDLVIIPSAFLFATVLAVNLLGDSLRRRWGVR
jgi:peptide/nickel transport system permease protein